MTGIVAGLATAVGVVALYRFAERRARSLRTALDRRTGAAPSNGGRVLDFEQDPSTGVYRSK
jgi:hypothetical protein